MLPLGNPSLLVLGVGVGHDEDDAGLELVLMLAVATPAVGSDSKATLRRRGTFGGMELVGIPAPFSADDLFILVMMYLRQKLSHVTLL